MFFKNILDTVVMLFFQKIYFEKSITTVFLKLRTSKVSEQKGKKGQCKAFGSNALHCPFFWAFLIPERAVVFSTLKMLKIAFCRGFWRKSAKADLSPFLALLKKG